MHTFWIILIVLVAIVLLVCTHVLALMCGFLLPIVLKMIDKENLWEKGYIMLSRDMVKWDKDGNKFKDYDFKKALNKYLKEPLDNYIAKTPDYD